MTKLSVQLVKPKNVLNTIKSVNDIETYIMNELRGINLEQHKFNPDIILYICNVVENWFHKLKKTINDEKINKKEIVLNTLKKLLPSINSQDELSIIQIIEHLHSSGNIKIVSLKKWIKAKAYEMFLKKE